MPPALTEDPADDRGGEHDIRGGVGLWGHLQQRVLLRAPGGGDRGAQHPARGVDTVDEGIEAGAQFGPLRASKRVELGLRVLARVGGRAQLGDILADARRPEQLAETAGTEVANGVHREHPALCSGPPGTVSGVVVGAAVDEGHPVPIPLDRDPVSWPFLADNAARCRVE